MAPRTIFKYLAVVVCFCESSASLFVVSQQDCKGCANEAKIKRKFLTFHHIIFKKLLERSVTSPWKPYLISDILTPVPETTPDRVVLDDVT